MARFEFKQDPPPEHWIERSTSLLNLLVRGLGLVLLIVGMFVALVVIMSAWSLYDNPQSIETFAEAVERGSHLDLTLSHVTAEGRQQADVGLAPELAAPTAPTALSGANVPPAPEFRFSYFAAWLIAILLLLLIGSLAISAVRTGGELALYDVQMKKLARTLLEERAAAAESRR